MSSLLRTRGRVASCEGSGVPFCLCHPWSKPENDAEMKQEVRDDAMQRDPSGDDGAECG